MGENKTGDFSNQVEETESTDDAFLKIPKDIITGWDKDRKQFEDDISEYREINSVVKTTIEKLHAKEVPINYTDESFWREFLQEQDIISISGDFGKAFNLVRAMFHRYSYKIISDLKIATEEEFLKYRNAELFTTNHAGWSLGPEVARIIKLKQALRLSMGADRYEALEDIDNISYEAFGAFLAVPAKILKAGDINEILKNQECNKRDFASLRKAAIKKMVPYFEQNCDKEENKIKRQFENLSYNRLYAEWADLALEISRLTNSRHHLQNQYTLFEASNNGSGRMWKLDMVVYNHKFHNRERTPEEYAAYVNNRDKWWVDDLSIKDVT